MATPNPLNNRSDQSCCSNLPFTNNSVLPCIPPQLETAERELELVIQIYNSWVAGSTCEANLKNVNMLGPVYAILANNDPNDILGKIEEPCALHLMTTNQVSDNILREQILETALDKIPQSVRAALILATGIDIEDAFAVAVDAKNDLE